MNLVTSTTATTEVCGWGAVKGAAGAPYHWLQPSDMVPPWWLELLAMLSTEFFLYVERRTLQQVAHLNLGPSAAQRELNRRLEGCCLWDEKRPGRKVWGLAQGLQARRGRASTTAFSHERELWQLEQELFLAQRLLPVPSLPLLSRCPVVGRFLMIPSQLKQELVPMRNLQARWMARASPAQRQGTWQEEGR